VKLTVAPLGLRGIFPVCVARGVDDAAGGTAVEVGGTSVCVLVGVVVGVRVSVGGGGGSPLAGTGVHVGSAACRARPILIAGTPSRLPSERAIACAPVGAKPGCGSGSTVGVGVGVLVLVAVGVGVLVAVAVADAVAVRVAVAVGLGVAVLVAVAVAVTVLVVVDPKGRHAA
jgi:hypothetical protein